MPSSIDPLKRLQRLVKARGDQQTVARELGISSSYLSDLLRGRRGVSKRVLASLGLQATVVVRKG